MNENPRRTPPSALVLVPLLLVLALVSAPTPVSSQEAPSILVPIQGKGFTRIPIAVLGSAPGDSELFETIRNDLEFSGYFLIVDPALYSKVPPSSPETVPYVEWQSVGAEALLQATLTLRDEKLEVLAYLHDTGGKTNLFAKRYGGSRELVRRLAHQISNDVIQHYTGKPGVALSRIAFVSSHGKGKEIYLMDYDGQRVRRLTSSGTINLSPAWSPDGNELAFMSWRGRQPGVYVMSSEGVLGALPTVGGELSSAPNWSPDGEKLAYTSDAEGNTEIYVLDRRTRKNRRLTHSAAIDTAPAFSPNGREIAFTSDRSGGPQIYLMDADGLNVRRVSWEGNYNDSATWAPQGDRLAFASRLEGSFQIVVLDLSTRAITRLTSGSSNNENPCWSPDGRHIVFASNRTGSYHIHTMRADGSDVPRLTRGGDSYTPDWSR